MRYVAVVITDDYSRCFGSFATKEAADAFAKKVNERVEKLEDAEWVKWNGREYQEEDMAPGPKGRAVVLRVREPRVRAAVRFADGYFEEVATGMER